MWTTFKSPFKITRLLINQRHACFVFTEGPLALAPMEFEAADVDHEILTSEVTQREWFMMQVGKSVIVK